MTPNVSTGFATVVLAAGGSSRLGRPKQLLVYRGEPLVVRIVRAAQRARCTPVLVVVGAAADAVRAALANEEVTFVVNEGWAAGIGSSIACGAGAVPPSTTGALVVTCDQPRVASETLTALVEAQVATGAPIVASSYADTVGVPALFRADVLPELVALPADAGAKKVLQRDAARVTVVPFLGGDIDVDTEDDYASLIADEIA